MNAGVFFATGVGGPPMICGKIASKTNEVFSRSPGVYFPKSPSKIVKKPMRLFYKGTQWATCSVPIASDALFPFSPNKAFPTSFKAKPCRRDLKAMYGSQGLCLGIADKARRTSGCLDVLNRSVVISEILTDRLADMLPQPFDDPLRVTSGLSL